jgi:hypothetical protein
MLQLRQLRGCSHHRHMWVYWITNRVMYAEMPSSRRAICQVDVAYSTAPSTSRTLYDSDHAGPCTYSDNAYSNKRWCCGDMVSVRHGVALYIAQAEIRWLGSSLLLVPVQLVCSAVLTMLAHNAGPLGPVIHRIPAPGRPTLGSDRHQLQASEVVSSPECLQLQRWHWLTEVIIMTRSSMHVCSVQASTMLILSTPAGACCPVHRLEHAR